ncbi:AAA family ATPase [uncultured Sulfitobacter sp.]|uniref:AAA family ATPase n=1 Tax=uncultured Sulfitobacter sp. TaxID=191468 RepID=UPI00261498E5|nr:AAA family ATPase [uncultured Sulfitobacter sp.]
MKLRSLTLTNVRKFAGQTATISGISDGVTVVAEANEFGKSTFFDALHALFFLKYGAATRDVKALQPRSGGPVRISAEVELLEGTFTLEKSYLAQKRATVRNQAGSIIALDDEAEAWIAQLMGSGLEGPAGLLWVRQGTTALEPSGTAAADKTEKERLLGARRNLLSSVAGEIDMVTGGRRMDRVIEAAAAALGRLATATGQPKANGPWKEAELEAQDLSARHDELSRLCTDLSRALAERREVMQRLAALEAPGAENALSEAVQRAQQVYDAAAAHADRLAQAEGQAALRRLELTSAEQKLDALIAAAASFDAAQSGLAAAKAVHEQAIQDVQSAQQNTQSAQTALETATRALGVLQSAREAVQNAALRQSATDKYTRAQSALAQVEEKRTALERAQAALATLPVTQAALDKIESAEAAVSRAKADVAAQGVQIELFYQGDARVSVAGGTLLQGPHTVAARQEFDLPGIGRMIVDPGAAAIGEDSVKSAQERLNQALQAVQVSDVAAARQGAGMRAQTAGEVALLENVLATLAPDGVARLQAEVFQAKASLDMLSAAEIPKDIDPQTIAAQLQEVQSAEATARAAYERARDAAESARTTAARAQARYETAQTAYAGAASAYGDVESFEARKAQAARAQSLAQVAADDAGTAADALRQDAPDLVTAQADLTRAKSAAENARDARAQLQTRCADLNATIRARAEDGVEEKRDEAEGMMRRAKERAARLAEEAAGLTLLLAALRDRRGAAQEAYFGPVQKELAPLLALLHADAALSFDPTSLLPQGIARGGADEAMETLSGGTQEQIAILTRLAFARLFARQGKPMPIILDDALVYSDDSRIVSMFTALHRVAHDQQVIVFTCRQMAFEQLGGARPRVEITQEA